MHKKADHSNKRCTANSRSGMENGIHIASSISMNSGHGKYTNAYFNCYLCKCQIKSNRRQKKKKTQRPTDTTANKNKTKKKKKTMTTTTR